LIVLLAGSAFSAERFRTDINPALIYYQAFALASVSDEDRNYLFATEWSGRPLDGQCEELIVKFDNHFKLLRQAAHSQVACDWGIDLTQGPEVLLPGLAKARSMVQAARLRTRWHLEHGRQSEARDDLLAAFVLSRNLSGDRIIISALVQIAAENLLATAVAENFFRFSPQILEQLVAGFDASPARGTLQQCMPTEKASFLDWFVAKIGDFQAETPGDDAQVLAKIRALFARTMGGGENADPGFGERAIAAAGGTSAGLVALFKELDPLYHELTTLLGLPFDRHAAASKVFNEKLAKLTNPLVGKILPAVEKARGKEFTVEVRSAMLRAAIEYKIHGQEGFEKVLDPCGSGPFRLERAVAAGVDRGFMLKSRLNLRGFDETLVFTEKDGAPLQVEGAKAGQLLVPASK
jgi:hypothetical protein